MAGKKIIAHFTVLTFCIAYLVSGSLIVLGKLGYRVYGWVNTLPQFCMDIPFAIYILSPAIASYIVLKKQNNKSLGMVKNCFLHEKQHIPLFLCRCRTYSVLFNTRSYYRKCRINAPILCIFSFLTR